MSLEQQTRLSFPQCPFCRDAVRPSDRKLACDACMTWHHADCWEAFQGRCSACHGDRAAGASAAAAPPAVVERRPQEALASDPREEVEASGLVVVGILLVAVSGIGLPLLLILLLR